MIFEVISAVAISVTISFLMSLGLAFLLHRKITVRDVHGLQTLLDGKADTRHFHRREDIIGVEEIFPPTYGEVVDPYGEVADLDEP